MPQAEMGKLNVRIAASAGELEATLTKTESRLKGFAKNAGGIFAGGGILGGLGKFGLIKQGFDELISSAQSFYQWLIDTGKAADELSDAAEGMGASAAGLLAIRHAAIGTGEALDAGLNHLSRFLGDAVSGGEEARATFARLGLSAERLAVLPLDQAALKINDAIKAMGNAAQ